MPSKSPELEKLIKDHKLVANDVWDCHGNWIIKHKALEKIAATVGIKFFLPTFPQHNLDGFVVCVTGEFEGREEWSLGEASKANSKNVYYTAMAEKRAKDRVILKLLNLHGYAYSEEEADDFKEAAKGSPKEEGPRWDVSTIQNDTEYLYNIANNVLESCNGNREKWTQMKKHIGSLLYYLKKNNPELNSSFCSDVQEYGVKNGWTPD